MMGLIFHIVVLVFKLQSEVLQASAMVERHGRLPIWELPAPKVWGHNLCAAHVQHHAYPSQWISATHP